KTLNRIFRRWQRRVQWQHVCERGRIGAHACEFKTDDRCRGEEYWPDHVCRKLGICPLCTKGTRINRENGGTNPLDARRTISFRLSFIKLRTVEVFRWRLDDREGMPSTLSGHLFKACRRKGAKWITYSSESNFFPHTCDYEDADVSG